MRLALAVMASLLPLVAAQAAPPAANAPPANTPNTTPAVTPTAAVGGGAPVMSGAKQAAASPATPAKAAETPNAAAADPKPNTSNPPAAAPTPTPTEPTFQFDMNPSSVYTACQTQPIVWHYHPNPEKKNITLYVYNEEAVNADPEFAPEATAGTLARPNGNARRSAPLEEIVKRQSGTRISQRIVKDWPANVAYKWVVDVPPGQYKFLAIVDGAGGDISYPLNIVADANMTCVKDFSNIIGTGASSSAISSNSAATSSGTKEKQPSASPSSAGASSSSKAAGAAASAGAQSDSDSKSSGISGGAIAGIVIGVLAGIALLALLAFCWRKKRRNNNAADYHVDPYSEPVREVRGGGGAFAPMTSDQDSTHQTSSFGHDGVYGGVARNPFETEPSTPVENTQTSHQTHTPNSSTGNASVYTAPMSAESELAYPPPVGLAPVNNRASAQSATSTFESAHTQAHPGSIRTFGHQSDRMHSFPSNRTLASDAHFVPGSDAPPVPVPSSPTKAAAVPVPTSPRRLPPAPATPQRLPPAPPSGPSSPQRLPPAPTTPATPATPSNIAGGAPVPSAYAAAPAEPVERSLERKISSRRKPVPRLSEDEEAALGTGGSPGGSGSGSPPKSSPSSEGNGSVLRLPKAVSSDGHEDWGSGLEAALNSTRKEYTLTADPPLHQD